MESLLYEPCPHCGGNGVMPKADSLRTKRKKARRGLIETAERMGISAPYLCDLEHGRRTWNMELVERFNKALR